MAQLPAARGVKNSTQLITLAGAAHSNSPCGDSELSHCVTRVIDVKMDVNCIVNYWMSIQAGFGNEKRAVFLNNHAH